MSEIVTPPLSKGVALYDFPVEEVIGLEAGIQLLHFKKGDAIHIYVHMQMSVCMYKYSDPFFLFWIGQRYQRMVVW